MATLDQRSEFLIMVPFGGQGWGSDCRVGGAGFHAPGGCLRGSSGRGGCGQVGVGRAVTACQAWIRSVVQG